MNLRQKLLIPFIFISMFLFMQSVYALDVTINSVRTFSSLDGSADDSDASANGIFTVNGNLLLNNNGSITCNDPASPIGANACPIKINVSGSTEMLAGSSIFAENRVGGGSGGNIEIVAVGNIALRSSNASAVGAIISSSKTAGAGDTGVAGNIKLNATSTNSDIILENGSKVVADANGKAGIITMEAGRFILVDGVVSSTGATTVGKGGPITIDAACDVKLGNTSIVSSVGQDPGADLVHLEAGCQVSVFGLVRSSGPGHTTGIARRCFDADGSGPNAPIRPDKPSSSTGCVEIWAGDNLTIDSTGAHNGEISADVGLSGGSNGRGWIDLYTRGKAVIISDENSGLYDCVKRITDFAVHANNCLGSGGKGGLINVKSTQGEIKATGPVIQADDILAGGNGGNIDIESARDTSLDSSSLFARGDFNQAGGFGAGGKIGTNATISVPGIRSFNGMISWQNGAGDVRPTGTNQFIPAANRGEVVYQDCTLGAVNVAGTSFPNNGPSTTPTELIDSCGGQPALPAYVTLPECSCRPPPPVCPQ